MPTRKGNASWRDSRTNSDDFEPFIVHTAGRSSGAAVGDDIPVADVRKLEKYNRTTRYIAITTLLLVFLLCIGAYALSGYDLSAIHRLRETVSPFYNSTLLTSLLDVEYIAYDILHADCGMNITYRTDEDDIALAPHFSSGDGGLLFNKLCTDTAAIIIDVNETRFIENVNASYVLDNWLEEGCGINLSYNLDTSRIVYNVLVEGTDGIVLDPCSAGAPFVFGLNGTEVVDTLDFEYISNNKLFTGCGLGHLYNATEDRIDIYHDYYSEDGSILIEECVQGSMSLSVNDTWLINDFNLSAIADTWFSDGCGIETLFVTDSIVNRLDIINSDGALAISACVDGSPRDITLNTVSTAFGGTGQTTAPIANLLVGNGVTWQLLPPGSAGRHLVVNSAVTGLEYVDSINDITATSPLAINGPSPTPNVYISAGTENYVITTVAGAAQWAPPQSGVTSITGGTNIAVTGTASTPIVSLSGVVGVGNGGTGVSSLSLGSLPVGSGTSPMNSLPPGSTVGHVLTMTAANTLGWQEAPGANVDVCTVVCDGTTSSWDVTTTGIIDITQTQSSTFGILMGVSTVGFGTGAFNTVVIGGTGVTVGGQLSVSLGGTAKAPVEASYSFYGPVNTIAATGTGGGMYHFYGTGENININDAGDFNTILNGRNNYFTGGADYSAILNGAGNGITSTSTTGHNTILNGAVNLISGDSSMNLIANTQSVELANINGVVILSRRPAYISTVFTTSASAGNNDDTVVLQHLFRTGGKRYAVGFEDINEFGGMISEGGNFITHACRTLACSDLYPTRYSLQRTDYYFSVNFDRHFQILSQSTGNYPRGTSYNIYLALDVTDILVACPGTTTCLCVATGLEPYDCVTQIIWSAQYTVIRLVLTLKQGGVDYWTYMFD